MPSLRPPLLLIAALFLLPASLPAVAQSDTPEEATKKTFRQNTIARCEQQYSVEQCQDEQFLEDNFHINSLEVAHRAAGRRNQLERSALRELTLQRLCNKSPSSVCATADDPARCAEELVQSCTALATQAANCQQNAKLVCGHDAAPANCMKQHLARCPSVKKQSVPELLVKYPQLSSDQKINVAQAAKKLDAEQGNWLSTAIGWLGLLL